MLKRWTNPNAEKNIKANPIPFGYKNYQQKFRSLGAPQVVPWPPLFRQNIQRIFKIYTNGETFQTMMREQRRSIGEYSRRRGTGRVGLRELERRRRAGNY